MELDCSCDVEDGYVIRPHCDRLRDSGPVCERELNRKRCLVGKVEREREVPIPVGESDRDEASMRVIERHRGSGDRVAELVSENPRNPRVLLESILARDNSAV